MVGSVSLPACSPCVLPKPGAKAGMREDSWQGHGSRLPINERAREPCIWAKSRQPSEGPGRSLANRSPQNERVGCRKGVYSAASLTPSQRSALGMIDGIGPTGIGAFNASISA